MSDIWWSVAVGWLLVQLTAFFPWSYYRHNVAELMRYHLDLFHSRKRKDGTKFLEGREDELDPKKRMIDNICTVFSIFMPLTTLPQIIVVYTSQSVEDLSLTMWVLYTIGVIPFLIFGVVHKERQLVVLNSLWLVMQITMIVGILIHR